ncbi:hypothetical protein IC614_02760 [Allosphingosinicella flava]|uniref:Trypsin-co-occurring domain-containing protein n=1 Tax=Allosphingosinicella flava TaxID=2771430 RepID=A0A7T2LMG9_9SPHN|nr:trypco2 family protein [Sphingosinicella flava]QPQ55541.1 hypothetical protein IC614_02760 [Sphingosinicella flava]
MANPSSSVDSDELAAFIASTLRAISVGVKQAHRDVAEPQRDGHATFQMPHKVLFDVAVAAKKVDELGGGLKVQVFSASGKRASEDQTVSRISFEIPWRFVDISAQPTPTLEELAERLA